MSDYEAKVTRITFKPVGEPIYCEQVILIEIEDESGGEYVSISQIGDSGKDGKVVIEPHFWPELRDAIDKMIGDCQG